MKVLVLGSGVIGVTTAYFLARRGASVQVIDRQQAPAMETSFANAGEVSAGYASPWAAPGIPLKAIRWLLAGHSPLVIRPRADTALLRWLWRMLWECRSERYRANKAAMLRIAAYSRDTLRALRAETGISYDERAFGTLQLFRQAEQFRDFEHDRPVLDDLRIPYQVLDRNACFEQEPALARVADRVAGGVLFPDDETGDCHRFTRRLAEMASALGVVFDFGVSVRALEHGGGPITGVRTDRGLETADAYVVALGSYTPAFLQPLGIDIPVYPVKGYSLTLPVTNEAGAPRSTVMDERYKVAMTRMGERIRVAGTAELTGYDLNLRDSRLATLRKVVGELFPEGGDLARAEPWCGLRPMTPENLPVLGRTPYTNLYLNNGHGSLGWTMSCGSGRVLADLITGHTPDIDLSGLTLARYG